MSAATGSMTGRDLLSEVAFLARELKTPVINQTFTVLGDQAREQGWSHEEYLAAVLGRQVASRTANGTRMRIAAAHFPAVKTIEDFSFDHVPAAVRDVLAHLATTTFIAKRENVVLLGPPGTGKTRLSIALAIKAAEASYPVAFDSATRWIERLAAAHAEGTLERQLRKLNRYRLIVIDEVGYLPFDTAAASLFFQLIASRYETGSVVVPRTSRSHAGAKPSVTTSSPQPPSTGSSTTPTSSHSTASPTGPAHTAPRRRQRRHPPPEPPTSDREGSLFDQHTGVSFRPALTAGMVEAGEQFRRVNGHLHLPALRAALARETTTTVTPACHDQTVNVA